MEDPSPRRRDARAGDELTEVERRLKMVPINHALAWTICGAFALLGAVTVGSFAVLGWPGVTQPGRLTVDDLFDLLKLVFALIGGIGAVVALVMAYRRQRVAEAANELAEDANRLARAQQAHREKADEATRAHLEEVAADARLDSAERRITELYTKAADQLGSEKAPVRLAGIYALERLAQDNPTHRQTIMDVICAYLRMPFAVADGAADSERPVHEVQELQVRGTAQRLVHRHLCPLDGLTGEPDPNYWGDLDLDLAGATLVRFALGNATVGFADFRRARFVGTAQFQGARFGSAAFVDCRFDDLAWFEATSFGEACVLDNASFAGVVTFDDAVFGNALFRHAHFAEDVSFDGARFMHNIEFDDAVFDKSASWAGARVRIDTRRTRTLAPGWTVRPATGDESDRLDTVLPERWRPNAAVSAAEFEMPLTDQIWGFLTQA